MPEEKLPPGLAPHEQIRLRNLLAEKALRKIDAIRLYEPLPIQEEFHESTCRVSVLRGSNRGGKTLPSAVEVARAVCGMDPYHKYPLEGGRCFCVGKDLKHIGEVMWRKLSRPGAFRIIRDEVIGVWRAFEPWDPTDQARSHLARPAPPLIPARMIKEVAWENKREEIPSKVKLVNGWEISFFSSLGKPPQGSDVDLVWFDEEIVDPAWFPEMSARILDRHGRIIWSATPQAGTEILYELHERAERDYHLANPQVREHVILLADNPHVREEDKKALAEDLSEDDRKVRIEGEFAFVSFRVYPEFNMLIHGVEMQDIPLDWTRYMVVDPGHQVCAVLFAAVPPPHAHEEGVYLYDELYLKDCDAKKFAIHVESKTRGQTIYASIIDPHGSLIGEIGSGKTVFEQYSRALEAEGFHATSTGSGFHFGSDDIEAGVLAVHGWLRMSEHGKPYLKVLAGRCPNLENEFKRYVKQRVAGVVIDKPNQRRNNHLMDDLRYLALHNPRYVKPVASKARPSPAMKAFKAKQDRKKDKGPGRHVWLGPGRSMSNA